MAGSNEPQPLRIPRPEEVKPVALPARPSLDEQRAEELSHYLAEEIQLARQAGDFTSKGGVLDVTAILRNLDIEKESKIINEVLSGSGWQGTVEGRTMPRRRMPQTIGESQPFDGPIKKAPRIVLVISPRDAESDEGLGNTIPIA